MVHRALLAQPPEGICHVQLVAAMPTALRKRHSKMKHKEKGSEARARSHAVATSCSLQSYSPQAQRLPPALQSLHCPIAAQPALPPSDRLASAQLRGTLHPGSCAETHPVQKQPLLRSHAPAHAALRSAFRQAAPACRHPHLPPSHTACSISSPCVLSLTPLFPPKTTS